MTTIKCTVDNCVFWGEGQICTAEKIWVKNDITGNPDDFQNHFLNASMVEFGQEFNLDGEQRIKTEDEASPLGKGAGSARTSPQTCCDTMRPKEK